MDVRQVDRAFRLGAGQQQVKQRIVRQVQQAGQRIDVIVRQLFFMRIQEAREDQVVLKQAAAGTPAQACSVGRIGLMRFQWALVVESTLYSGCRVVAAPYKYCIYCEEWWARGAHPTNELAFRPA